MRKILLLIAVLAIGIFTAIAYAGDKPGPGKGNDNPGNKVTLCHATGSKTNPFVEISPNANGAVSGHAKHEDDIIPVFDYNDHGQTVRFPGLNLYTNYNGFTGAQVLANHCAVPSKPTTTTAVTTTTKTVTSPTTTAPGKTVTGPTSSVPGSTTTVTVPGSTVTGPTTTLPGKKVTKPVRKVKPIGYAKPPIKKHFGFTG